MTDRLRRPKAADEALALRIKSLQLHGFKSFVDRTLFSFDAGTTAVVGPNGSGKSTLLNIIGALDRPTSGQVLLDGQDLSSRTADELAAIRNREVGFVFQAHHLLPQCSALENVLIPTLAGSRAERAAAVERG